MNRPTRQLVLLALGLVLAAAACAPPTDGGPPPSTTPTSSTSTTTTTTVPSTYRNGRCAGAEGVTVVVDFAAFDGSTVVRCALGTPSNGADVLTRAGFTHDPGRWPGTVCRLAGLPTQGHPYCWTTGGYWSYWKATTPGQAWKYSEWGLTQGPAPRPGEVEGWRFGLFADGTQGQPPRVGTSGPVTP